MKRGLKLVKAHEITVLGDTPCAGLATYGVQLPRGVGLARAGRGVVRSPEEVSYILDAGVAGVSTPVTRRSGKTRLTRKSSPDRIQKAAFVT